MKWTDFEPTVKGGEIVYICDSEQEQQFPGLEQSGDFDAAFGSVLITNLTAKIKENIPVYVFMLEIPMAGYDGKFLFKNIKSRIGFEFGEMEKAE